MLATFCLRLACGLIGSLSLFSPAQVNPRFYRIQFLIALGLSACALAALWPAPRLVEVLVAIAILTSFVGSILWSLDGAPFGRAVIALAFVALSAALVATSDVPASTIAAFTSAVLLGTATTAMLMGHSYLIAPSMSLTPLLNLLRGLFGATLLRMSAAGVALWSWTNAQSTVTLNDEVMLWLPVRWLVGFAGPLILGYMALQAAKIRSTQSATGILYVVVICCFLGELTSQLLTRTSHFNL